MCKRTTVLVLFFFLSPLWGATETIIYREKSYGSDSTFNPLSQYLNLAFDTTQNPYYFSQSNFFANHGTLWNRIKDPGKAIEDGGGFREFVSNEIFGLRAVPNYTLHLIGGGYDYRWLAEWYRGHGVSYPYVVAFVTSYLANISNEALETSAKEVAATDHIADLFLFDIAGKILFMHDPIARFFHDTLKMRGWHFQPMFDLRTKEIVNSGSNYIFRPEIDGRKYRPFIFVGMTEMAGMSVLVNGQDAITGALGIALTDPLILKGTFVGALFWDKEDALMSSLIFNGSSNLAIRANVYPDVVDIFGMRTGIYAAFSHENEFAFGLNLSLPAGLSGSF